MSEPRPHDHPEFSRVLPAHELSGARVQPLSAEADAEERAALARLLDAREVASCAFSGELRPEAEGVWRLSGRVAARLTQTCVVTLAPVETEIDEPVDRLFSLAGRADGADLDFDPEAEDPPDPVGAGIDYGAAAAEALALALDPYPRAPGAAFEPVSAAPPGAAPIADAETRPFAALAALRKAMDKGD